MVWVSDRPSNVAIVYRFWGEDLPGYNYLGVSVANVRNPNVRRLGRSWSQHPHHRNRPGSEKLIAFEHQGCFKNFPRARRYHRTSCIRDVEFANICAQSARRTETTKMSSGRLHRGSMTGDVLIDRLRLAGISRVRVKPL